MLAEKMGISTGSFKNKLNPNQTAYKFTEKELEKLKGILLEIAIDIGKLD